MKPDNFSLVGILLSVVFCGIPLAILTFYYSKSVKYSLIIKYFWYALISLAIIIYFIRPYIYHHTIVEMGNSRYYSEVGVNYLVDLIKYPIIYLFITNCYLHFTMTKKTYKLFV